MTPSRGLLGLLAVLTAVLLQSTVLARLPLPGAAPDVVLVLVVAFGLAEGSRSGMLVGFGAGLLSDLASDAQLGRLALAYALVGCLAGLLADDTDRSVVLPFVAVAVGGVVALVVYAGEGVLLGDARITLGAFGRSLVSTVPYSVALTPFVVPVVASLIRRLDADAVRR